MEKNLKFVKGSYEQGKPAHIYFYDDVDYWDVREFISEFQYLENYVRPSKICVHIISVGGSCLEGIKVCSIILNSAIPTETINDGLAASMGSVIWAAGKERFMRDYAVLMLHNPRIDEDELDAESQNIVATFKKQLQIIYKQRFGFDDEKIENIMNGTEDIDGTWFFAEDAIEAGFIDADHIVKSKSDVVARIAASVDGVKNLKAIGSVMMAQQMLETQHGSSDTIQSQTVINQNPIYTTMTENEIKMVTAQLGIPEDQATGANVTAKVKELLAKEQQFDAVQAELAKVKTTLAAKETELAGSQTSVSNLKENLATAQAELQVYKDKEAAEKAQTITDMVEAAITAGKIAMESKDTWVKLATDNFDLAKQTLDNIPAREDIGQKIASDPANAQAASEGMRSAEQETKKKVEEAVGKEFHLLTPNF